jgi:hypothetical protein
VGNGEGDGEVASHLCLFQAATRRKRTLNFEEAAGEHNGVQYVQTRLIVLFYVFLPFLSQEALQGLFICLMFPRQRK